MHLAENPQHKPCPRSVVAIVAGAEFRMLPVSSYKWAEISEGLKQVTTKEEATNLSTAILLRYVWDDPSVEWETDCDPDSIDTMEPAELLDVGRQLWREVNSRRSARVFSYMAFLRDHDLIHTLLGLDKPSKGGKAGDDADGVDAADPNP
jgi:hypothetical protein